MDVHCTTCREPCVPVALFRLGHIQIRPNALARLTPQDISAAISRHQAGDWGDLDPQKRLANNRGLENQTRLLSRYRSAQGIHFRVITEANRRTTIILLPEDD